jgi:hypothetical protein
MPRGNHGDLARLDVQHAELGRELERAFLGNDQQLAVRVVEDALHRAIGGIEVHAGAVLRARRRRRSPGSRGPRRKSVGAAGTSCGRQRRRFGEASASAQGAVRTRPSSKRAKGAWPADGRSR